MIPARQKDAALLADVRAQADVAGEPSLWWLGQSGFLLRTAGHHAIIDPYLSDSLTAKYAGTDRPHVRLSERCLDPAELGFVNLAFSTHGHTDHFDRETLRAIAGAPGRLAPLRLVLPMANVARARDMLADLAVDLVGVRRGQTVSADGFTATAVPAAHPEISHDGQGNDLYLGYSIRVGRWTVYHSGDTLWREPVVRAAAATQPDIALLPINGHDPARGVAGNLNAEEAACLAHAIGARAAVPQHYDMFAFNTASPEPFEARCRALGVLPCRLGCGERLDLTALGRRPGRT